MNKNKDELKIGDYIGSIVTREKMTSQNILKFDPRLGLEKHLTGESGCTNCSCKLTYVYDKLNKKWEWLHTIPDKEEDEELDLDEVLNCIKFEPKKSQTIRNKPAKVGDKYEIWSTWSGMEKGFYCPKCFTEACLTCKKDLQVYPKKLFDVEITECIPFEMIIGKNILFVSKPDKYPFPEPKTKHIPYSDEQHPFIKADWPDATNKQFIDFLLKYVPEIKERRTEMWLWKFRRIG